MGIKWWLWLSIFMQLHFCVCPYLLPAWWVQILPLAAPFSDAFLLHALCSRTIPLRMISGGATVATQRTGNDGARIGFSMGRCIHMAVFHPDQVSSGSHTQIPTALLQEGHTSCHFPSSWERAQVPLYPWNCLWFKAIVVKLPAGCTKKDWVWKEPFCRCNVLGHNRRMFYGHCWCGLYGSRMGMVLF